MENMGAVCVDTTAVTAAIAEPQFEEAHLVALVHGGAVFHKAKLLERPTDERAA
jgi:hypothetical protein